MTTSPRANDCVEHFHWHVGICQRAGYASGRKDALEEVRTAVAAALAPIKVLIDNGDGGAWIKGTKIVRVTSRRTDLGADVTESMVRVEDIRAALAAALVPYPGEPDYPQRHGRESHASESTAEALYRMNGQAWYGRDLGDWSDPDSTIGGNDHEKDRWRRQAQALAEVTS